MTDADGGRKNFAPCRVQAGRARDSGVKSFLLLFCKKEGLSPFRIARHGDRDITAANDERIAAVAQLTIKINGYAYTVGCDDGQERHLLQMAADVETRIDSIKALGARAAKAGCWCWHPC